MEDTTVLTDKSLIELADQAKQLVDDAESKNIKLQEQNIEFKKIIITAYGFIRTISLYYDNETNQDMEIAALISVLRSYLSSCIEPYLD
tara:strand:- start:307 stop:573 length:267 start_codon:yes stop_codon:yes gene_type:complete